MAAVCCRSRRAGGASGDRVDDELRELEDALGADPEDALPRYERARTLARSGATEAALAEFDALLAEFPDDADYLLGRAQMLARLGQNAAAVETAERALDFAPDYEDVWQLRLQLAERAVTMRRSPRCAPRSRRASPTRAGGGRRPLRSNTGAGFRRASAPIASRTARPIGAGSSCASTGRLPRPACCLARSRAANDSKSPTVARCRRQLEGAAGVAASAPLSAVTKDARFLPDARALGRCDAGLGGRMGDGVRLSPARLCDRRRVELFVHGRKVHRRLSHSLPTRPLAPVGWPIRP